MEHTVRRIRRIWHRALGALGAIAGRRRDDGLAEEIESHLRLHTEDNLRLGMSPDEARRAALLKFGGVESVKEGYRDQRGLPWIETIARDVRVAVRALRKEPGFTVTCVLTLALAIGGNSAIFSAVNAVLLRPLPYPDAQQLVSVWETNPRANRWGDWASYPDFADWQRENQVFDSIAAFRGWSFRLTSGAYPEMLRGMRASPSLFSVLQVVPMLGRPFVADDGIPGRNDVAILSYGLWQRQFGSDPALVGKTIAIDGRPHVVIGVMPPGFVFPAVLQGPRSPLDLWVPVADDRERGSHNYRVIARLRSDRTLAQAETDMHRLAGIVAQLDPGHQGRDISVAGLQQRMAKDARPALLILLGAISLVLLIACTNVANLLLARGAARQKEAALRQALGAGRRRILQQWITESVVLALIGGMAGLLVAYLGVRALVELGPPLPLLQATSIDRRVLAFTLVTALATGLAFGVAPAFQALRVDVNDALKESGGRHAGSASRSRLRRVLTIAELALALMLLVGAGLLGRSFLHLRGVDAGFQTERLVTALLAAPVATSAPPSIGSPSRAPLARSAAAMAADAEAAVAFFQNVITRLEAIPGVRAVAGASAVPFVSNESGPFRIEGRTADAGGPGVGGAGVGSPGVVGPGAGATAAGGSVVYAERPRITPGYFRAMGIPLLRGRDLTWADHRTSQPVAIVSEQLAATYWPNGDAIGKRVSIDEQGWLTVVGIAKDVRHDGLDQPVRPTIYVPVAQHGRPMLALLVRTESDPAPFVGAMRRTVMEVDKNQPLFGVQTMTEVLSESVSLRRFLMILLGAFAAVAALLGVVGVYGVLAYFVNQRRQEIGIRLALGAHRADVVWLVLRQAALLTLTGIGIGIAGALALSSVLSRLLFGVTATDFATFAIVPALLALVVLAASCVPARAAARVEPMTALRGE